MDWTVPETTVLDHGSSRSDSLTLSLCCLCCYGAVVSLQRASGRAREEPQVSLPPASHVKQRRAVAGRSVEGRKKGRKDAVNPSSRRAAVVEKEKLRMLRTSVLLCAWDGSSRASTYR